MQTTIAQIVDYWSGVESEIGLSVDWAEAHELCWRCAYRSRLERCHIVPDSLGGSEAPENLILLCGRCHREAPNVSDPRFMWAWLRAHATSTYETYWTERGLREYELIFKRKPFSGVRDSKLFEKSIRTAMRRHLRSAIVHFGEGRLNPSTIAWVISSVEKDLFDAAGDVD